ncbi:MAG: hypothetical protein MH252_11510 [Thermosynechococcaceae cyanobacterium MS004]|nr:hypothetical protein [Thermosynechococcaceae cyanobacterium MS004]
MIQKIREAIGLFAANWSLFSLIVLTVWLPGSILLVYLRLYVFPEATGGDEFRLAVQEFRISSAIEFAFGPLYMGAMLYAASQLKKGLHPTYSESMTHAARRSFKLLGTRIGTGLLIFVGLIALIIPGVILSLRFALIDAIVVLEGIEGSSARNLSVQLTRGKRWNILGAVILTFILLIVATFLVSFILYFPLELAGQNENFVVAVICECVINILLSLLTLVLFLFYWEAKNEQSDGLNHDNQ